MKPARSMLTLFLLGAALAAPAAAVTLFVDWQSPSPAPPYASWATAARTIQAAVDAAQDGDLILVAAGNYNSGGRPAPGKALTNRVTIAKAVTVASSPTPANRGISLLMMWPRSAGQAATVAAIVRT